MRLAVMATFALAIILGLATPFVHPQQGKKPSAAESEAEPYISPPAWKSVEIGDFYLKRRKFRAALSRYQEALTTDPYYARGYLGLGKVYDRLGLSQKALEAYRKYLDLLPSTKDAAAAKEVHKAMARLERQLKNSRKPPLDSSPSTAPASPPR
jgi:tetratricopeptide (TPR) repeat protein